MKIENEYYYRGLTRVGYDDKIKKREDFNEKFNFQYKNSKFYNQKELCKDDINIKINVDKSIGADKFTTNLRWLLNPVIDEKEKKCLYCKWVIHNKENVSPYHNRMPYNGPNPIILNYIECQKMTELGIEYNDCGCRGKCDLFEVYIYPPEIRFLNRLRETNYSMDFDYPTADCMIDPEQKEGETYDEAYKRTFEELAAKIKEYDRVHGTNKNSFEEVSYDETIEIEIKHIEKNMVDDDGKIVKNIFCGKCKGKTTTGGDRYKLVCKYFDTPLKWYINTTYPTYLIPCDKCLDKINCGR